MAGVNGVQDHGDVVLGASEQDLDLGVALGEVGRRQDAYDLSTGQATDPYVDTTAVDGPGSDEVAIVERVDDVLVARVSAAPGPVDGDFRGFD